MSEHRRESDLNPESKIRITVREALAVAGTLIAFGGMGLLLYSGITSRLDLQAETFKGEMKNQQTQIQGVKDAVDDLKKRLDLHEQRTWGRDGRP